MRKNVYSLVLVLSLSLAQVPHGQVGIASWYGYEFEGRKTASGSKYNPNALTCASRTWPLGTKLLVKRIGTDLSVVLTVNDRGPYVKGRVLDLSRRAAQVLGMLRIGIARVFVRKLA